MATMPHSEQKQVWQGKILMVNYAKMLLLAIFNPLSATRKSLVIRKYIAKTYCR